MHRNALLLVAALSVPAFAPAQPLAVWTPEPFEMLDDDSRPTPGPPQLRLVGPRNGMASGVVAARGADMLRNPRVTVSDLRHTGGAGTIPAARVTVRYGSQHHRDALGERDPEREGRYFHLSTAPLETTRTLVAWITVNVPAQAAPGTYQGQVTVQVPGGGAVPLTLVVSEAVHPPMEQYGTHVNFLHSPDSVALRYEVPMWSDAHFELLAPSYAILRALGQSVLHLGVVLRSDDGDGSTSHPVHFGTREGVIRFRGEGAQARPDFTAFDAMLGRWRTQVGSPQFVVLTLWDQAFGRQESNDEAGRMQAVVTGWDGRQARNVRVPYPGTSGSEAVWQPVIEGVRQRVRQIGWDPDSVILGTAHDRKPIDRTVEFFNRIAPGIRWNVISHGRGYSFRDGQFRIGAMEVAYHEYPWNPNPPENLGERILGGWDAPFPVATIARFHRGNNLRSYRWLVEGNTGRHHVRSTPVIGPTRFKLEYWGVPGTDGRGRPTISSIMNMGGWVNLMRNHTNLGTAGPRGMEPSAFLLQAMEGVQEAVARVEIEKILTDESRRARVSPELRVQAYEVLNERADFVRANRAEDPRWEGVEGFDWREHVRKLYDTLAAMQQAAGGRPAVAAPPAAAPAAEPGPLRAWTNDQGQEIRARLIGYQHPQVMLEREDGRRFAYEFDRLSETDQEHLRGLE